MPKDRKYTRKELESLRRADLQQLFKINGLRGANQSSAAIIDALLQHFSSPGWISPARRGAGGAGVSAPVRPGQKRTLSERGSGMPVVKGSKESKRKIVGLAKSPKKAKVITPTEPIVEEVRMDQVVLANDQADPSTGTMPPPALPPLSRRISGMSSARVQEMLEERDRAWEARLQSVEEMFERRVQELERKVEEQIRLLIGSSSTELSSSGSTVVPQVTLTMETPENASTVIGKRAERYSPNQTPGAGPSSSPAAKRARVETTEDEDSDIQSPHTPPAPAPPVDIPRTPSPGHQGLMTDNSQTPGVTTDIYNQPPPFSMSKRPRNDDDEQDDNDGRVKDFPYPMYATTPRPTEPSSPTLDAPPSASRHRLGQYRAATLTPGRRKPSPAPRAVSEAHKELHTITESDEPPISVSLARRRVASEHTPSKLVAASLRGSSVPVSPPQLSPSPSIGATEREGGFTYTPFPPVPRVVHHSTLSRSNMSAPERTPRGLERTDMPKKVTRDADRDVSPMRGYMDVAMYGLLENQESSTQMATPNHRTMLGTERYRDTRFGDVPEVSWGSPSVDLGPNTPASFSRRDW